MSARAPTFNNENQESEMHNNKTLKGLLAVSAVAAMFSAFGVKAQTSVGSSPSQTGTSSTNPNMAGKTTKEGTMDNTNSTGMENRVNQVGEKGSTGAMGASGAGQTGAAAGAAAATGAKLGSGDEKAVKDMAMADMAEVATGKLAQSKGQSAEVKAFGQQMIDDHGAALAKVQALAQARGVTLPTELDAKHKAMSAKLEKMSGAEFDKAYMAQAGVKDHTDTHKKLMADARKIKDPEVKALADQHMPVVEQHLKAAQQMSSAKSGTAAGK
jgi:predicted outer membrane protein